MIKVNVKRIIEPQECCFRAHYGNKDYISQGGGMSVLGINMSSELFSVDFVEDWHIDSKFVSSGALKGSAELYFLEFEDAMLIYGVLGHLNSIKESVFNNFISIFKELKEKNFITLIRSWNFIPFINQSDEAGLENYKAFCQGRALAFESAGIDDFKMPAATGIGSHAKNIFGYLVAAKNSNYKNLDNPLQMPAYRYPRRYGPKSPSFSRATVKDCVRGDGSIQIFISGTASIRGHQTLWEGDVEKQVNMTMENIEYLISRENIDRHGFDFSLNKISDIDCFKIYFRIFEDKERIESILIYNWGICRSKLFFMNVDICRSDLLVEIEGVVNDASV